MGFARRLTRPIRMWRLPYTSEVIMTTDGARFRVTWERSPITHRRDRIIGIERWTALPAAVGPTAYGYTMWRTDGNR